MEYHSPTKVLRVENLQRDLIEMASEFHEKLNINVDFNLFTDKIRGVNNSVDKLKKEKTILETQRIETLPAELRNDHEGMAARYGYTIDL
jgi:hypothetical protein